MAMALTFRAAVAPALPAAKLRRQASAKVRTGSQILCKKLFGGKYC
jgi:hypothetical protein